MTYGCEYEMFAGNRVDPPEYCENDAMEGSEFCEDHQPYEPDPDRYRDEL